MLYKLSRILALIIGILVAVFARWPHYLPGLVAGILWAYACNLFNWRK